VRVPCSVFALPDSISVYLYTLRKSILARGWYDFQSEKISRKKPRGGSDRYHGVHPRGAISEELERGGVLATQSCSHRDKPGGERDEASEGQNEPGGESNRYHGVYPRGAITEGLERGSAA
jgi:hypothetical protein